MREKPDDAGDTDARAEVTTKRIDLSVPQVAGSALAAVVAAKLASSFGVYGTILGAGLISVVATCGGSVLQHLFKRTGEQLREKRTVGVVRAGGPTDAGPPAPSAAVPGEFTEGTVYRARPTGWKRPVAAAALVFAVAMAGITTYELASGQNLGGGHSTTVGNALSGHNRSAADPGDSGGSGGSGDTRDDQDSGRSEAPDSGSGDETPAATPSGSPSGTGDSTSPDGTSQDDDGTTSSPTPTPDATGGEDSGASTSPAPDASATTPEPGASSRSGTAGPGQDGPATP
ncbi:hypothetical protein SAM40697_5039 [Streptomyces ambofaciens]|uniref:Uncharacterized protein n=1 Tax=Streptomyces ambofaciens TaxID=1889 RepID=A0ABM6B429_STRAM|nr:hypothetical protein [Streptomyces ambofaciens]ANB08996.1 hypothetical protein SAM40697_5039 [Streptomyces ambofaciens]